EFVFLIYDGAAAVAADDVRVGNEIEPRREIQIRFLVDPTLRQIEGRFVVVLGRTLIQPSEIGKGRDLFSILFVAAHDSIGKPERERRIRKTARAFDGKTRLSNFGIRLFLYFLLRVINFARLSRWPIDETREIKHRI